MKNYEEALQWLYSRQLFGIKLGLENMIRLAEALGDPQDSLRFIHVAGTNGKGSVCALTDAIVRAHGVRTGLFTSPHLVNFTERIRVDGKEIPHDAVFAGLTKLRNLIDSWHPGPTFFELVCALALDWFRDQKVEVVVWETGMGGRLDATNIVTPEVSVITSIGMDHQRWLGDTLEAIAWEKAGIIKAGVPAIWMPQSPSVIGILTSAAAKKEAPLIQITRPWHGPLGLAGEHQRWNAAGALAACQIVLKDFDNAIAAKALAQARWPGRFQLIPPNIILDGAHNPAAATALLKTWMQKFPKQKARLIFGALADKAVDEVLAILSPMIGEVFFVPVRSARSLSPAELQEKIPSAHCCASLQEAFARVDHNESRFDRAENSSEPILITGSLFLVGEALALLQKRALPRVGNQ